MNHYRFLLDNVRDIILFVETDGRVVEANRAALNAYGFSREELLGKTIFDLRADLSRPVVASQMATAGAEGLLFEAIHRRKDGSVFPVEVSSRGADMDGRRVLLSVIRDISERKRAEADLRAEREQYQMLFDKLVEAFALHEVILDRTGAVVDYRFLDANPAFETMTGLKREDIIGKTVLQVFPDLEHRWIETYGRVAITGEVARFEDYSNSLRRNYEVVAFRPREGQFATLFFDVTELRELDRLKDQFISVAAHELKTPVAVMKGYAQLLLRGSKTEGPQRRRHLEAIDRGADRIDKLVNDLLEVSQFQLGKAQMDMTALRLDSLLADTVSAFAVRAPSHRLVVEKLDPAVVRGDRRRLERVILNLLDNAVRYSPPGSEVRVRLDKIGGQAAVVIEDKGIGIPGDKQARISDLFYRAHTGTAWDYGGIGAGLFIARETAAIHGGRLWFESHEDQGSSFHFSVPVEASE